MSTSSCLSRWLVRLCACCVFTMLATLPMVAQTPAFPEADGAGKYTTGGRGTVGTATTVFEVTSLGDSNVAGTLRYACSQSATYRTIVFRVSGTIHLTSSLSIPGNTTIAGQTAPGDGICLADYWVTIGGNNVIIRYLRFRLGDKNQLIVDPASTNGCNPINPPFSATCRPYANVSGSYDSLGATSRNNLMIDHCSVSWSDDEALSLKNCDFTTIQWTLISEPLDYSYHYETDANGVPEADFQQHGYGGIFGGYNASFHHNIYAHCKSRCPRFHDTNAPPASPAGMNVDLRNNVLYNWRINTAYGGINGHFNFVSNYYKAGPDTGSGVARRIVDTEPTGKYYLKGNKVVGPDGENGALSVQATTNNWYGTDTGISGEATLSMAEPILTNYALTIQHTALEAYNIVLAKAGASIPKRDSVDARVVNEIKTRTGGIIDVQGGYPHGTPYSISSNAWPVLLSTTAPTDTDHDGMPDFWESANGLNPASATDRNTRNAEGYTMLEVYLNSLTLPPYAPANLVATPGDTQVALKWSPSLLATNYNVWRATTSGGPYTNIATVAATNHTDITVANGTTYYYVVTALSAGGESTNSAQVSATPQGSGAPPAAPQNLSANATNAAVALNWSAAVTATNYNVKRATSSGGPYSVLGSTANTNYNDATALNGTTYYYVVSAVNPNGEGANSTQASATPQAPPAAPLNLTATAGNAAVTLNWSASATATNYNVKRSTSNGGPYAFLGSTAATSYNDTSVINGTTYHYVVSAANLGGEGPNSAQASATPQAPPAPTNFTSVTIFNDTFNAGSTLNSLTPSAPTPTATCYQLASSKSWSPTPSLASGHLKFGIAATTSGLIEAQALFTNAPVALKNAGDSLTLIVTFTNTYGLFTQTGMFGFGLYNSGQNQPVPGGMNNTVLTTLSNNATGNAQTWVGYVAQLTFTNSSSQILTRPPQTGPANNNQELLTTGSGSSYANPGATTVGTASAAASVALITNNPYTDTLTITYTTNNSLAITNRLYAGVGTNGTLLSEHGAVATGGTYLTNAFDAFAIGWRSQSNSNATSIDINQITVQSTRTAAQEPAIPRLNGALSGGTVQLSWPAENIGWRLQTQTNAISPAGWVEVGNSDLTNQVTLPLHHGEDSVFFRLINP